MRGIRDRKRGSRIMDMIEYNMKLTDVSKEDAD